MGRAPRIIGAGMTSHVTARGNGRQPIFVDDRDRRTFLTRLGTCVTMRQWQVWAYCLMGNHVHLCVTTQHDDLSAGMRDLLGTYSRWFNWRHARNDHLFGQRFGAKVVADDPHLLATIRYIARNPERAGLGPAKEWPWSSYPSVITGRAGQPWMDAATVLELFHRRPVHARVLLRQFVELEDHGRIHPPPVRPTLGQLFAALESDEAVRVALERGARLSDICRHSEANYSTLWRRFGHLQSGAHRRAA